MDNINNENKLEPKTIHLRVLTPLRVIYDSEVEMIIAKTVDGDMGVLYGHEPRSALLEDGALRIFLSNQERKEEILAVLGGILTVKDNSAVILSDVADTPENMQELIEKMKAGKAANKLREQNMEVTTQRMELAIRQALVHMDISAYSMLKTTADQDQKE